MSKQEQLKFLQSLIGEKVFVKCLSYGKYFYNDSTCVEEFTGDDYVYYEENILCDEIELVDIMEINGINNYFLVYFKDLVYRC